MYILITILTSFNEYILYETYNSVINQKNHNLKYNIIIVVNSLNKNYYQDVLKKFKNIDVEIIETKSNGKPGMGHNSCINLFKNRKEYDYLIPIDGDDYLYPYGLHQIEKLFVYNPDIIVGGNEDVISNFKDLYTENSSIDLNHKYCLLTPRSRVMIHCQKCNAGSKNKTPLLYFLVVVCFQLFSQTAVSREVSWVLGWWLPMYLKQNRSYLFGERLM